MKLSNYYKNSLSEVKSSRFFKNILTLVSGTAIAQMIPIILQPVLRRLYSPDDFGAFAIYLTIVSVLAVLCSLRYEQAIVIPENETVASNIFVLSMVIGTISSIFFFFVILAFKTEIAHLLKFPEAYIQWLLLIPFSVFLITLYEAINNWLIRTKSFRASAINKVSRRTLEGAVQISFGFKKTSMGLFLGDVAGNFANVTTGIIQVFRSGFDIRKISKIRINYSMLRFSEFPKYNLFPNLLNTLSTSLPILFVNNIYSKSVVGHFDLSRQVLSIPAALITASIFQVLYQKVSEAKNSNQSIKKDMKNLFLILLVISIAEIFVIYFFGVYLFSLFFGTQWVLAGEYSRLLVFSYAVKFIVSPISAVLIPFGKMKILAGWQIFYFLIMCSFFLFRNLSCEDFILYFVIIDIVSYIIYLVLIAKAVIEYEAGIRSDNLLAK